MGEGERKRMQQKRRKRNWGRDSENIRKDEVKERRQKERE